jgi:hypothetical protein
MIRRIVTILLLVTASCFGGHYKSLPASPSWIKGQGVAVQVSKDREKLDLFPGMQPEVVTAYIKDELENDLTSAGFVVVPAAGPEDLRIVVEKLSSDQAVAHVFLGLSSLEEFNIRNSEGFVCFGIWISPWGVTVPCVSRSLVTRLLKSDAVAKAGARIQPVYGRASSADAGRSRRTYLSGKLAVLDFKNFTKDLRYENPRHAWITLKAKI